MLALLVEVQLESGDLAAAKEPFEQLALLRVNRKDDRTRAVAKFVGGTVRAARGDQQARADFQAALELFFGPELVLPSKPRRRGPR